MNAKAIEGAFDIIRSAAKLRNIDFFREHPGFLMALVCLAFFALFSAGSANENSPPAADTDDHAELRQEADERGNIIREWYLGADGKPVSHKDGYAEVRKDYDERGNVIRLCYLDLDGNAIQRPTAS
ncbi:MAG: hypothetical protein EBS01_05725 [Verrucomicrobia bacterium]|nr:hypothetical protein [Verrucomicrobiota bacterium]